MKKLTLFAMLLTGTSLTAQLPYFQQEHASTTAGVDYTRPVDIHFDAGTKVYSYHASGAGGTIVVKYSIGSGAVIGVTYLSRGTMAMDPVRVRTQGNYYYALFNIDVLGERRYCLVKLDATTNALVFVRQIVPLLGTSLYAEGIDFIPDGGAYVYVLGNTYDAVNDQNDLTVTKIDVSTAMPSVVWHNTYLHTTRSEYGGNLVLQNNALFASFSSVNTTSFLDRGQGLLKLDLNGNYLASGLYKYASSCTAARASRTWVMTNGAQLTLSSTSYVGADGNGPLWLANINPLTLGITSQVHHTSGAAYMNPEIQNVSTVSGNRILMSGSAPWVNTATPGFVHYFFDAATLGFVQGTKYPSTNASDWSGEIYDAYLYTGTGKNIFSVALNQPVNNNYYLLKTSDLGDNGCDIPVEISPSPCTIDQHPMPFTTHNTLLGLSGIKAFSVSALTDTYQQSCYVTCPTCPIIDPTAISANGNVTSEKSGMDTEATVYPNPVNDLLTITLHGSTPEEVEVFTLAGLRLAAAVTTTAAGVTIDFSSQPPGSYLVRATLNGERRTWRIVKQ